MEKIAIAITPHLEIEIVITIRLIVISRIHLDLLKGKQVSFADYAKYRLVKDPDFVESRALIPIVRQTITVIPPFHSQTKGLILLVTFAIKRDTSLLIVLKEIPINLHLLVLKEMKIILEMQLLKSLGR